MDIYSTSVSLRAFTAVIAVASFLACVVWFMFLRPINIIQGLDRKLAGRQKKQNDSLKKYLINKSRNMKKYGDLPPPYPNSWYAVLESDQIVCGEIKELLVLGRSLVAWRGKLNGKVSVSDPFCPHLGAHLGQCGKVIDDCIECPFHLWSFSGETGKVQSIPYSKTANLESLTGLQLWQVKETNGYVFIWYHAEGHAPTWSPEGIKEINGGLWKYRGRSEFWTTCHIQEIPENGADTAHLKALHEPPALPVGASFLKDLIKHEWVVNWQINDVPNCGHETILKVGHDASIFGKKINFLHMDVDAKQIGAGIVVLQFYTSLGRGVLIQTVTPVEPLIQRITHRFYSESKFIHPLGMLLLYGEAIQIARDIEIWNSKCYQKNPCLVKEERNIKLFRKWFSQFYSPADLATTKYFWKLYEDKNTSLNF